MAKVKPEQPVYVYGLHTEGNELIMYIGCSTNPEKRLRQHLSDALLASKRGYHLRPLHVWIVSSVEGGDPVSFTVLGSCQANEGPERENEWIDKARAINPGLLNTTRRSPYCCHIDDASKAPRQKLDVSTGDTVAHTLKVYANGIWKYDTRTCKVLRVSRSRILVGGDIDGTYKERWVSPFSLRVPEVNHAATD